MTKTLSTCVLALALLGLARGDASAQTTPTLSITVQGSVVSISWTPIPGALGYTIAVGTESGVPNVGIINLPASITSLVVGAPDGTYFVRVRPFAGGLVGGISNEAIAVVGAAVPCVPVAAPVVTAAVSGGAVTLNWGGIAGAAGYQVQFSRFPGGTELVEQTASVSHSKFVGMLGTFYARVMAVGPCGSATSAEVAFTIDGSPGAGPRTPNPGAGGRLPIPNAFEVVKQVANARRDLLRQSCSNFRFMELLVATLRTIDTRYGFNCKRGNCGDLSKDVVAYNWGSGPDEGTNQIYTFDAISGHCGSNPGPAWQNTQPPPYVGQSRWTGGGRF